MDSDLAAIQGREWGAEEPPEHELGKEDLSEAAEERQDKLLDKCKDAHEDGLASFISEKLHVSFELVFLIGCSGLPQGHRRAEPTIHGILNKGEDTWKLKLVACMARMATSKSSTLAASM